MKLRIHKKEDGTMNVTVKRTRSDEGPTELVRDVSLENFQERVAPAVGRVNKRLTIVLP